MPGVWHAGTDWHPSPEAARWRRSQCMCGAICGCGINTRSATCPHQKVDFFADGVQFVLRGWEGRRQLAGYDREDEHDRHASGARSLMEARCDLLVCDQGREAPVAGHRAHSRMSKQLMG